jgi:hypothetical protein
MKIAKCLALLSLSASLILANGCVALVVGNRGLDVDKMNGGKSSPSKTVMQECKCNPEMCHVLKSPDGRLWRVTVDNMGALGTAPVGKPQPPMHSGAIGAPMKYSPEKDTEPIPTLNIKANK